MVERSYFLLSHRSLPLQDLSRRKLTKLGFCGPSRSVVWLRKRQRSAVFAASFPARASILSDDKWRHNPTGPLGILERATTKPTLGMQYRNFHVSITQA